MKSGIRNITVAAAAAALISAAPQPAHATHEIGHAILGGVIGGIIGGAIVKNQQYQQPVYQRPRRVYVQPVYQPVCRWVRVKEYDDYNDVYVYHREQVCE